MDAADLFDQDINLGDTLYGIESSDHTVSDHSSIFSDMTSGLHPPKKKNYQKAGLFSATLKEEYVQY